MDDFEQKDKKIIDNIIQKQKLCNTLKIDNYIDNVNLFYQSVPFFYDRNDNFWMWDAEQYKWQIVDETDIMNAIDSALAFAGQTVTRGIKGNYLEAFKRVGRQVMPKELPKEIIQFKDKLFNISTKEIINATPEYFACNPIPHALNGGDETPVIDKLFTDWVGQDKKDQLYEILAYCCLVDYPISMLFALIGTGANGKSTYQNLICRFLGHDNVTSTELDTLLTSRFESAKLYKKLACFVGETDFGVLSKTSLLKKLTGLDPIGFEFKNKTPFTAYNYAKILIGTNSLPSTDDTQDGFYRRWMIIRFPNQFTKSKDIIKTIPQHEYGALARKVTKILPELLNRGHFTNQGSIEQQRTSYIANSNPFPVFLTKCCVTSTSEDDFCRYSELYTAYVQFLKNNGLRVISKIEFTKALDREGHEVRRTNKKISDTFQNDRWVEGIKLKPFSQWEKLCDDCDSCDTFSNSFPSHEPRVENTLQSTQSSQFFQHVGKNQDGNNNTQLPYRPEEIVIAAYESIGGLVLPYEKLQKKTGLSDEELDKVLSKLCTQGAIYSPKSGFYGMV